MHRLIIDLYLFIVCFRNGIGILYRNPAPFFSSKAGFDDAGGVFAVLVCDRDRLFDREGMVKSAAHKMFAIQSLVQDVGTLHRIHVWHEFLCSLFCQSGQLVIDSVVWNFDDKFPFRPGSF